ncbi:S41 family peptidase [Niabella beijingensis]|uniref:S41 family peptidase n=1 Tax=Niabella beijingensis TaxID=2872700 RepID=UPI001CBB2FD8|nr:S41 family peptidase [Niabella beijingensis]MBZ4189432.1 hypothetical protein [Niabella beijingensis]
MRKGSAKKILLQIINFALISFFITAGCKEPDSRESAHTNSPGMNNSRNLLSVQGMREDLSVLWSSIQEIHPAFGLYTPKDRMLQLYKRTAALLDKPMSENDFIATIYPFISALKCGHTQLKHSQNYTPSPADRTPHLPFKVLVREGRVWVTTHQTRELITGDELLTMNRVPVSEIIQHGSDLYAADGNNMTFKELFLSEYDGFEDACNKYYHWIPPYAITVRTTGGKIKTRSVDTLSSATPPAEPVNEIKNYAGWTASSNTDYLPLRFFKNKAIACFEVHSYQYTDTTIFKKAFEEIHARGIKNLIIDLRHNTGGDIRIAANLMTYLADTPFQTVGAIWTRVPDPARNRFARYFDLTRTESFYQSFQPTGVIEGGHYKYDFRPAFGRLLGETSLNKTNHYNGNLFVLIDGATFSSGAHSAAIIKKYCKKVLFIGRETAGGSEGCSGGTLQHLTLPNTGIIVEFPWLRLKSVLNDPVYGHGIIPDYTVAYTPQDVTTKKDVDLEKALYLIQ